MTLNFVWSSGFSSRHIDNDNDSDDNEDNNNEKDDEDDKLSPARSAVAEVAQQMAIVPPDLVKKYTLIWFNFKLTNS